MLLQHVLLTGIARMVLPPMHPLADIDVVSCGRHRSLSPTHLLPWRERFQTLGSQGGQCRRGFLQAGTVTGTPLA
jgi:hypothetical protein